VSVTLIKFPYTNPKELDSISKTSTKPFCGSTGRITRIFERMTVDKTFVLIPGLSLKLISDRELPSFR
jgi:hypothetical protein